MTYNIMLETAINQAAIDLSCAPECFLNGGRTVAVSKQSNNSMAYLNTPLELSILSFGSGVVASCCEELVPIAKEYIQDGEWYECFTTPKLFHLNELLRPVGRCVKYISEFFLPQPELISDLTCGYDIKQLFVEDFADLYTDDWSNALCKERKHLDYMGFGAYDDDKLIALAACSKDCKEMYQIGIDVLPGYRRRGLAKCLTSRLTKSIVDIGKVPFYSAQWSNISSVKNAVSCGFRPAWVQIDCKKL